MKSDDKEAIDAKVKNLSEIAQPLAEKAQAKVGADAGGDGFTDAASLLSLLRSGWCFIANRL
jgi:hypothetical protein